MGCFGHFAVTGIKLGNKAANNNKQCSSYLTSVVLDEAATLLWRLPGDRLGLSPTLQCMPLDNHVLQWKIIQKLSATAVSRKMCIAGSYG